jgi:hypothetical protein
MKGVCKPKRSTHFHSETTPSRFALNCHQLPPEDMSSLFNISVFNFITRHKTAVQVTGFTLFKRRHELFVDESNVNYEFAVLRSIPHLFIYGYLLLLRRGVWTAQAFVCRLSALTQSLHFWSARWRGEESRNKTDLRVGRLTVLGAPKVAFVFMWVAPESHSEGPFFESWELNHRKLVTERNWSLCWEVYNTGSSKFAFAFMWVASRAFSENPFLKSWT